jgi:hypothetical protein
MSYVTPVGLDDGRRSLVRSTVVDSALIAVPATIAGVAALLIVPQHPDAILKGYLAVVGLLIGLVLLNRLSGSIYRDPTSKRTGKAPRTAGPNRPAALLEIEQRVSFAKVSAFDYQGRLRPLLIDIATQRLAASAHIDLSQQPDAAKALLGSAVWEEIQGAAGAGDPRDQPGMTAPRLRVIVDRLESI